MIKLYFLTILYIILTTYANCDKYRIITQVNYNDNVRVVIYGSLRTRLKIALANESGPLVKATFNFVTVTSTNDGLPHSLEHLLFLGSKKRKIRKY
uniref:Uncharacterized protein n=1 Tax=Meloidogyne enterolobii TaxID=390850 RepID=A0A6V7U9T4_MELEN|nr:unnamed protein product [Meloidogyne enterolobii]CAD2150546.1 unnamed protein product [Meloidogyne enterolobii]